MTRLSLGLVALMSLSGVQAGAQPKLDRGLPLLPDGSVRIYNTVGSVRVTAWKNDSIAVRGNLGEGNVLHFGGGKSGVKMFVEGRDERNPAPAAIEVMVPSRAKVWVKTATADVEVNGVSGSVDIYVVGGRITVTGSPADLNAEAIDGVISITGSPGWIRAKSASGSVTFTGASSDVALTTVSGDIVASGKAFEKAKFETVTGGIRVSGAFRPGGLVTLDTHSGIVDLRVPEANGLDLDVVSIAGSITNRLTGAKPMKGRYGRGSELAASNAGGGTRVTIRSFKGTVSIGKM